MLEKVSFQSYDYLFIGLIYVLSSVIGVVLMSTKNKIVTTTVIFVLLYTIYILYRFYYN